MSGYRENRWYELCYKCSPEIKPVKPFTPRVCPEHLKHADFETTNVLEMVFSVVFTPHDDIGKEDGSHPEVFVKTRSQIISDIQKSVEDIIMQNIPNELGCTLIQANQIKSASEA